MATLELRVSLELRLRRHMATLELRLSLEIDLCALLSRRHVATLGSLSIVVLVSLDAVAGTTRYHAGIYLLEVELGIHMPFSFMSQVS